MHQQQEVTWSPRVRSIANYFASGSILVVLGFTDAIVVNRTGIVHCGVGPVLVSMQVQAVVSKLGTG